MADKEKELVGLDLNHATWDKSNWIVEESKSFEKDGRKFLTITLGEPVASKPKKPERAVLNWQEFVDSYPEKGSKSIQDWDVLYDNYLDEKINDMYDPKIWLWDEFFTTAHTMSGKDKDYVPMEEYFGKKWYKHINDNYFDGELDKIFDQFESDLMDMEN